MYNSILKPFLFTMQPERAHSFAMKSAKCCLNMPFGSFLLKTLAGHTVEKPTKVMDITFDNKVGLAAGFDKDGEYIEVLKLLGFGYIEVGTITPRPQPGNPKLFRLKEDQALINRMGFNNKGVHNFAENIRQIHPDRRPVIGGNIGKNKDTPNSSAWMDYVYCLKYLHSLVDYFTINLSSPNTPGLRALQEKEPLIKILSEVQNFNQGLKTPKPLLLKVSPDNSKQVLDDIILVTQECGLTGVIATNTTIERNGLRSTQMELEEIGGGGLSGVPLREKSLDMVKYLHTGLPSSMTIIGVGGISNHDDYRKMLDAGADLVQIYTSFIYQGVSVVKKILESS